MSNRVALAAAGLMLIAALALAMWGTSKPAVAPPAPIPTEPPAPEHAWQDADLTEDGELSFAILEEGKGPSPADDDLVEARVKGWVKTTELPFQDDSFRGPLGEGELVEGVKRSLRQMKPGEVRQVHVPASLGYGQTGLLPRVPRDTDLVYELTLRSVTEAVEVPESPPEAEADQTVDGVRYAVLEAGSGEPAKPGDTVEFHFTTWLADGTLVDSTLKTQRPVSLELGAGSLYAGLESALTGMQAGERRKAVIPPEKAFGESGRGPIPANATLVVEVALVAIR